MYTKVSCWYCIVIDNVMTVSQDLSTLGASDLLTRLPGASGFRRLTEEFQLVRLVVLESKVDVARVMFHQVTAESLVKLQLADKSIIRSSLRSPPRHDLQHGGDGGATT